MVINRREKKNRIGVRGPEVKKWKMRCSQRVDGVEEKRKTIRAGDDGYTDKLPPDAKHNSILAKKNSLNY